MEPADAARAGSASVEWLEAGCLDLGEHEPIDVVPRPVGPAVTSQAAAGRAGGSEGPVRLRSRRPP